MSARGVAQTDLGPFFYDGGQPTGRDLAEVRDFQRFLQISGPADDEPGRLWRIPGWIPYVLGIGPAPPEGFDLTPITAWSFPA